MLIASCLELLYLLPSELFLFSSCFYQTFLSTFDAIDHFWATVVWLNFVKWP